MLPPSRSATLQRYHHNGAEHHLPLSYLTTPAKAPADAWLTLRSVWMEILVRVGNSRKTVGCAKILNGTVNNQEVAVPPGSRRFSLFPLPCALGSSCTSELLLYYVNELSGPQYALFGLTRQSVPLSCNVSFAGGAGKHRLQLEQRAQLDTSNFSSSSIRRILWNVYKHTLCVHLSVYKLPTMRMVHAGKSGNFLGVGILNQPLWIFL